MSRFNRRAEDVELRDEPAGRRQSREREHADRQGQAIEGSAEAQAGDVVQSLRVVLVLGQHGDDTECADVHQRVDDRVNGHGGK